jgi:aspartate/methionine/tyrosine aminotransferase
LLSIEGAKDIAIEINSLSKSHNMAGWRMGMAASNSEFINYVLRVKSNMDSGMFRPLQEAAVEALNLNSDWFTKVNETYLSRRVLVWELMDLLNCSFDKNQVGMFIWGKVPDTILNGQTLSDQILYNAHVFLTPGFIFGSNGEKYIRISLCTPVDVLKEAIERIRELGKS